MKVNIVITVVIMSIKKYYQILGLEDGASKQEIQDSYDKLSLELDPKNNDNLDFFKEEFALLHVIYFIFS